MKKPNEFDVVDYIKNKLSAPGALNPYIEKGFSVIKTIVMDNMGTNADVVNLVASNSETVEEAIGILVVLESISTNFSPVKIMIKVSDSSLPKLEVKEDNPFGYINGDGTAELDLLDEIMKSTTSEKLAAEGINSLTFFNNHPRMTWPLLMLAVIILVKEKKKERVH